MSNEPIHDAHIHRLTPDADALYSLAEPHDGYFTAAAAASAGYSRALLAHHVRSGLLERVEWGIYRLRRFPETRRADLIISHLRAGPGSAISHQSALELYDLSDALPSVVHITVPRSASRRRRGMSLHTGRLDPADVTVWNGIPVTRVERTIADVVRSGHPEELVLSAIQQALSRGLTTSSRLAQLVESRGGRLRLIVSRALEAKS